MSHIGIGDFGSTGSDHGWSGWCVTGTRKEPMVCLQKFASGISGEMDFRDWSGGLRVFFSHMSGGGVCWNSLLCERVRMVHEEVLKSRGMTSSIMKGCTFFKRCFGEMCALIDSNSWETIYMRWISHMKNKEHHIRLERQGEIGRESVRLSLISRFLL